jgi:hypothetical protein
MARYFLRNFFLGRTVLRNSGMKILVGAIGLLAVVCLQAPVALAQHGGFGGGHVGGGGHFGGGFHSSGGARASTSSGSHGSKTGSIFHIFRRGAPASAHSPAVAPAPITLSTNPATLYRPVPVGHPGPVRPPVFFVPVYFGSPFFYGGFNSFGYGCGGFWGGCFYSPYSGYGYGGYGYGLGGYYGGFYSGWGYAASGSTDLSTAPARSLSQSDEPPAHRNDLVELFFKDGTVSDVTDYWVVEGQLHFLTVDESGQKIVEHVVPFDTLDLQTTTDDATSRGFKFQLRNESMEQYFREHPEVVPKGVDPDPPQN